MGRENKKEAVAALHREQIMKAAETLFLEKGFAQTTIEDISRESAYSRRTIYAYFESKDDILYHIVETGLRSLKQNIEHALGTAGDFIAAYWAVCAAMENYQRECPQSAASVNQFTAGKASVEKASVEKASVEKASVEKASMETAPVRQISAGTTSVGQISAGVPDVMQRIFELGEQINQLLADWIEKGKGAGIVRQDVVPMMSVYIMWSSITALFTLLQTKGIHITGQFSVSREEFLNYGLKQVINSILEVRI